MVQLKNIKIGSKYAEADFYPEDIQKSGHIVVNLTTKEITSCIDVPGYGSSYKGQAAQRLVKMASENDQRAECTVMWY